MVKKSTNKPKENKRALQISSSKTPAITQHAANAERKDPNVYAFPQGLGFGAPLYFYKYQKDQSVNFANKYLEHLSNEQREILKKLLISLLELWKLDFGIPNVTPSKNGKKGSGTFGILTGHFTVEDYDEEERYNLIKNMPPWKTSRFYSSPIALIEHIYYTKHQNPDPKNYRYLIATAIIYSDEQGDKSFWPEIILESIWFAEFQINTLEGMGKDLFDKSKRLLASDAKRTVGLRKHNEGIKESIDKKKKAIHAVCDRLLNEGKPPRDIPKIMEKIAGLGIGAKQIKRHLKDHNSGHWA